MNKGAALNAIKNVKIVPDGLTTVAEDGGGGEESAYWSVWMKSIIKISMQKCDIKLLL